jgi:hypothetical protein
VVVAMTPTNHGKSHDLYGMLTGLGLVGLAAVVTIANALRLENELLPRVGDIIAFDRTATVLRNAQTRITAMRAGGSACELDVRAMWASGGSLLIEAAQFKPSLGFRVHWAGTRTSDGPTDCGTAADLLLTQNDINVLTFAAGGSATTAR